MSYFTENVHSLKTNLQMISNDGVQTYTSASTNAHTDEMQVNVNNPVSKSILSGDQETDWQLCRIQEISPM